MRLTPPYGPSANALEKVVPGGDGDTLLYNRYRYVPPQRVCFFRRFGVTTGIDFSHFGPESDMVFEEEYERIWRFRMNKKERVMGKFENYLKEIFLLAS